MRRRLGRGASLVERFGDWGRIFRYQAAGAGAEERARRGEILGGGCDFLGAFSEVFLFSRTFGDGSRGGMADEAVVSKTLSGSSGNRGEPDAARVEAAAGTVPSRSAVMVFSYSRTF